MQTPGRIIWLFLFFLFPGQSMFAQTYRFRHLTIEDGLSQSSVNCMLQDRNGFLWFGTQDGLNRYDGYTFKVFRHDPADSNSLTHNWIWNILEDREGDLWIATWKGLTRYDPSTGRFRQFYIDTTGTGGFRAERPAALCQDTYGHIWIATWGHGLERYDPQTGMFRQYVSKANDATALPGNFVREVFCDSRGRLWVGTWSGLALAQPGATGEVTFVSFRHRADDPHSLGGNNVMSVTEDHAGRIWIATRGGGLNLFREEDSSFVQYLHSNDLSSLSSNDVSVCFEDHRHRLWVGTFTEGLNLFDPGKGTFTRISNDPDLPGSLTSNNVYSIFEDRSGLLWVGAGGINILDERMNFFRHYRHDKNNDASLSNNEISDFYEDRDGEVWVATEGGGLNRFDRKTGLFSVYRHDPHDPFSLVGNNVSAVAGNSTGILWVACRGSGFGRLDPVTGKFISVRKIPGLREAEVEGLKHINDMCFTSDSILWIATENVGLLRYNVYSRRARSYNTTTRSGVFFPGNALLCLDRGTGGILWIGTWGIGLYALDTEKERFVAFRPREEDTTSLYGNIVHTILETADSGGRTLWVGTNRGLFFMDPAHPEKGFRHLTAKEGLPSNVVYGVLQDEEGHMWVSTTAGLTRYAPEDAKLLHFDVRDGLQSNEFNGHSCLRLRDGTLLFGGVNGFNLFRPLQIRKSDYPPPVVLTSFKVFNKEMLFRSALCEVGEITLTWKQNFFSFEFAALDYARPDRIRYAYRMQGVDRAWIYSGNRRYASYTKIDPGEYLFQVKGTNRDGLWSDKVLSLKIRVKPPFWRTWWFKTLGIFFFLMVLYGLHRMQLQKLLAVEHLRVRIASDLHDDVGSALTRIAIASEQMQVTPDRNRRLRLSKNIGAVSREIISTMSDIIWSIDARNDTLQQLTDRMQDHLFSAFPMSNIRVSFHQEGMKKKKKIPVDIRQNIFYIFKEVINNIVKHAEATEVTINLKNTERGFVMEIADNGKGFDTDRVSKGNGLKNIRMRAERLRAGLDIRTQNGTKIILRMKRL